jgi:hypothetical protein
MPRSDGFPSSSCAWVMHNAFFVNEQGTKTMVCLPSHSLRFIELVPNLKCLCGHGHPTFSLPSSGSCSVRHIFRKQKDIPDLSEYSVVGRSYTQETICVGFFFTKIRVLLVTNNNFRLSNASSVYLWLR